MNSKTAVLIFVALAIAIDAQLLCYHCEDCASSNPIIQPCGFSNPVLTTPQDTPENAAHFPWEPILTLSPDSASTMYPQYPPEVQGNPILTPPTIPAEVWITGWNEDPVGETNNGGGLLTTKWPESDSSQWWNDGLNVNPKRDGAVSTTVWPSQWWLAKSGDMQRDRYTCVTTKLMVNNRQIIRRGCARKGRTDDDTCSNISDGKHYQCALCEKFLCNIGM